MSETEGFAPLITIRSETADVRCETKKETKQNEAKKAERKSNEKIEKFNTVIFWCF
jgi:hypothetical protein